MEIYVVNTALESRIPNKFHLHKAQVITERFRRENSSSVSGKSDLDKWSCTVFAKDLIRKYLLVTKRKAVLTYIYI